MYTLWNKCKRTPQPMRAAVFHVVGSVQGFHSAFSLVNSLYWSHLITCPSYPPQPCILPIPFQVSPDAWYLLVLQCMNIECFHKCTQSTLSNIIQHNKKAPWVMNSFNLYVIVCQMLSQWTKNWPHSIIIWDTVTNLVPLCSVY